MSNASFAVVSNTFIRRVQDHPEDVLWSPVLRRYLDPMGSVLIHDDVHQIWAIWVTVDDQKLCSFCLAPNPDDPR